MPTVNLNVAGPDPAEVTVTKNTDVTFQNNLSADTTVTCDAGLLPGIGNGLLVPKDQAVSTKVSAAASSDKKFYYDNQDGTQAPRQGIIDVT